MEIGYSVRAIIFSKGEDGMYYASPYNAVSETAILSAIAKYNSNPYRDGTLYLTDEGVVYDGTVELNFFPGDG